MKEKASEKREEGGDTKVMHSKGKFYVKTPHGIAVLLYKPAGKGKINMYHTFVPDEDRGKGIAEKLAFAAFAYAKEKGLKVIPGCSYVSYFVEKHQEYNSMIVFR
ncbi:MAG: GNAT family N-acetyltransferase [Candidatus Micrarchaeia archaeon]|jgi:predicted GNAT family acetyltransferase